MELDDILRISQLEVSEEKDNDICSIVQFVVDPTYMWSSLKIASRYVSDMILERLLIHENRKLKRFFWGSLSKDYFAPLRANLFESYAHLLLSGGGEFLVRSLDDNVGFQLHVPPRKIEKFPNFSQCIDQNRYYIPCDSNRVGIDSVLLTTGCFQMTVAFGRNIPKSRRMEITDMTKLDKLYFVVPDENFKVFTRQKLVRSMRKTKETMQKQVSIQGTSKMTSVSHKLKKQKGMQTESAGVTKLDHLRQYVLCVSFK